MTRNGLGVYHCMGVKERSGGDSGACKKVTGLLQPLSLEESEEELESESSDDEEDSASCTAGVVWLILRSPRY